MHIETIREYILQKPSVTEGFPFGEDTLVFKVNEKIFLLAALDSSPLQFNVKCDPDKAIELRDDYPESVLPGYHMNKKHWNTIIVDGRLTAKQLKEMIDDSYELVSPKKRKK
ncbi:MAG: MmcQ/YjbR family DNA-binding protein [Chitinophagaceae bacterium]|nr:MmcQ/YjbR family DNA-binding protein [Chitinophagaceae bacterium]MBK9483913.1 MmcQ/YjbR family DNA-binding protein [Chitinophagaceae bacterium]MBL0200528.1 MmcQ/YjbR family DNA-binding protein [Chitinophagaceae bacterium]